MALDKQIHLYSIDTSRFYNDVEFEISKKKMKATYIVNGLKEKRKKETNTHKTHDGHFVHLFLRDFYIRSNRKEIRRVGIAITFT